MVISVEKHKTFKMFITQGSQLSVTKEILGFFAFSWCLPYPPHLEIIMLYARHIANNKSGLGTIA
jgi:hypothetical protein